jgi:hypothetical protein
VDSSVPGSASPSRLLPYFFRMAQAEPIVSLFTANKGEQQQQQQEGSLGRCGPQRHDEEANKSSVRSVRPNAGLGSAGGQTGQT